MLHICASPPPDVGITSDDHGGNLDKLPRGSFLEAVRGRKASKACGEGVAMAGTRLSPGEGGKVR